MTDTHTIILMWVPVPIIALLLLLHARMATRIERTVADLRSLCHDELARLFGHDEDLMQ